jgi:hypothetical protein
VKFRITFHQVKAKHSWICKVYLVIRSYKREIHSVFWFVRKYCMVRYKHINSLTYWFNSHSVEQMVYLFLMYDVPFSFLIIYNLLKFNSVFYLFYLPSSLYLYFWPFIICYVNILQRVIYHFEDFDLFEKCIFLFHIFSCVGF